MISQYYLIAIFGLPVSMSSSLTPSVQGHMPAANVGQSMNIE